MLLQQIALSFSFHRTSNALSTEFKYSYCPFGVLLLLLDRVSLCSLAWPQTHNPPTSASQMLG
jgi:hypothetical protein